MMIEVEISTDAVMKAFLGGLKRDAIGIRAIVAAVSHQTGIPQAEILGQSRVRDVAKARQAAMALARRQGYSYPQIGRVFQRDHTTIIHACKVMGQAIQQAEAIPTFRSRRARQ